MLAFWLIGTAQAAVPGLINFQGRLTDSNGSPVTSSTSLTFRLYQVESNGSPVFTETQTVVPDSSGIYAVFIGSTTSLSGVDFNSDLWLEVEAGGETLTPRYRLTAAPYAIRAETTNAAPWAGLTGVPAGFADGTDDTGSLGPNSVGTVQIQDSSVTSAKILDGQIVNADLAASAGITLAKLEKDPSQTGTINTSTNPVDWSQLKNVPAAFSDGTDDLGGGQPVVEENDVTVDNAVSRVDFLGAHFNVSSSPAGEANVSLDVSSVTVQGNAFNGTSQLVRLDGSGNLPALNASNLTNLPAAQLSGVLPALNAASLTNLAASALTGNINSSTIDSSSVTKQGNTFNGVSQLVKLDGSGNLPALNASALTNLSGSALSGTINSSAIDSSSVTKQGNTFNGTNQLVKLDGSGNLPAMNASALTNLSASALTGNINSSTIDSSSVTKQGNSFNAASQLAQLNSSAFIPNANVDSSSVTKQGNTFNGVSQLVKLDGSGNLPALNASALTNLDATDLIGTINSTQIDSSSVTKQGNSFNVANTLVKLDSSGYLVFNSGTAIAKHLSTVATINFASTAGGNCINSSNISVTGAAIGETVNLGIPNNVIGDDSVFYAYVSGAGTVVIRHCNIHGGLTPAAIDPPSGDFRVDVWQH